MYNVCVSVCECVCVIFVEDNFVLSDSKYFCFGLKFSWRQLTYTLTFKTQDFMNLGLPCHPPYVTKKKINYSSITFENIGQFPIKVANFYNILLCFIRNLTI